MKTAAETEAMFKKLRRGDAVAYILLCATASTYFDCRLFTSPPGFDPEKQKEL
jgi:hypothetical protein